MTSPHRHCCLERSRPGNSLPSRVEPERVVPPSLYKYVCDDFWRRLLGTHSLPLYTFRGCRRWYWRDISEHTYFCVNLQWPDLLQIPEEVGTDYRSWSVRGRTYTETSFPCASSTTTSPLVVVDSVRPSGKCEDRKLPLLETTSV